MGKVPLATAPSFYRDQGLRLRRPLSEVSCGVVLIGLLRCNCRKKHLKGFQSIAADRLEYCNVIVAMEDQPTVYRQGISVDFKRNKPGPLDPLQEFGIWPSL